MHMNSNLPKSRDKGLTRCQVFTVIVSTREISLCLLYGFLCSTAHIKCEESLPFWQTYNKQIFYPFSSFLQKHARHDFPLEEVVKTDKTHYDRGQASHAYFSVTFSCAFAACPFTAWPAVWDKVGSTRFSLLWVVVDMLIALLWNSNASRMALYWKKGFN